MNPSGCANCLLYGWKQMDDLHTLQRCTRCKLIQYCGRECQAEHWKRIHKKQCRYFADPAKAQKFGHNEEDCAFCVQAAQIGKAQICKATNPNYECVFKEEFPPRMYHPHPFPITGQPEDTHEKITIVLWQLIKKFQLTQPGVFHNCHGKLVKVYAELKAIRLDIWKGRKISRQSGIPMSPGFPILELLDTIRGNLGSDESMRDLFQIIQLVTTMFPDVVLYKNLQLLINPLADIPPDLHGIVSQAVSNSVKYLALVNQVLDALANQIIPYQDLTRLVCGGSLDKQCSFCSETLTISSLGPFCEIGPSLEIYSCGSIACQMKANPMVMGQDYSRLQSAVWTTVEKLASTRCDFCSKVPPSEGGHRCKKCLTVIYCSTTCQEQDWRSTKSSVRRRLRKERRRREVQEGEKRRGTV